MKEHSLTVLNSPGLVSSELFLACQEKLSKNAQLKNAGKGKHSWLSGLLKCADCGYSISIMKEKNGRRRLICSGRYNLSGCNAVIRADLTELEEAIAAELERLLAECPEETPAVPEKDSYTEKLADIDRRADRLLDAFAASEKMGSPALARALDRLEKEREHLLESRKRERNRVPLPEKLIFSALSLEEKKLVVAQFIERIEVGEDSAEVKWIV